MAEPNTTAAPAQNKTPLYAVCIALIVAVILAIVGFSGKNSALDQNAELTAQLETITAASAELEEKLAAATADVEAKAAELEVKAAELETAQADLTAAGEAKAEVDAKLSEVEAALAESTAKLT